MTPTDALVLEEGFTISERLWHECGGALAIKRGSPITNVKCLNPTCGASWQILGKSIYYFGRQNLYPSTPEYYERWLAEAFKRRSFNLDLLEACGLVTKEEAVADRDKLIRDREEAHAEWLAEQRAVVRPWWKFWGRAA